MEMLQEKDMTRQIVSSQKWMVSQSKDCGKPLKVAESKITEVPVL